MVMKGVLSAVGSAIIGLAVLVPCAAARTIPAPGATPQAIFEFLEGSWGHADAHGDPVRGLRVINCARGFNITKDVFDHIPPAHRQHGALESAQPGVDGPITRGALNFFSGRDGSRKAVTPVETTRRSWLNVRIREAALSDVEIERAQDRTLFSLSAHPFQFSLDVVSANHIVFAPTTRVTGFPAVTNFHRCPAQG